MTEHILYEIVDRDFMESLIGKPTTTRILRRFNENFEESFYDSKSENNDLPTNGELLHFYDDTLYITPSERNLDVDDLGRKTTERMEKYFSSVGLGKHIERVQEVTRSGNF